MDDFGKLVYLDMHKTGSSTISKFMEQCCTLPRINLGKHDVLKRPPHFFTYYFTSIRQPKSLYLSLFRYGCLQKGSAFNRMKAIGNAHLYANEQTAFDEWFTFITSPAGLNMIYPHLEGGTKLGMGLMSIRHFMYSVSNPFDKWRLCDTYDEVILMHRRKSIVRTILKNEHLNDELRHFATVKKPRYFDQSKVDAFFSATHNARFNATSKSLTSEISFGPAHHAVLQQKERLLLHHYR